MTGNINAGLVAVAGLALASCSMPSRDAGESTPRVPALFHALSALCGQAFEGRVVSDDPQDADWASQRLVMHARECSDTEIRIPLHVGDDRSRTWVVSVERGPSDQPIDASGVREGAVITCEGECDAVWLRLKHDHRHEDGSEDVLTQYGGDAVMFRTDEGRVEFPADDFSRRLFEREGIPASMENVWSITLTDETFTYALDRPGRHFAAEFDLTRPIAPPPPPWGFE